MKAKFKIKQLAAVDTIDLELVHPKHGATGIMLKAAGPTHPAWKEALDVWRKSEDTEADNLELLASTVLGWDEDAFELPYTKENVIAVLGAEENTWIVNQVGATVRDHTKFFL